MTHDATNILLIQDSPTDAEIVRRALRKGLPDGCIVHTAGTMAQAESFLNDRSDIDIILLDLGLPDTRGRADTFMRLEKAKKSEIPTMILTSVSDHALAVELVGSGAQDFVGKQVAGRDPAALCESVMFAIARHKNLQKAERRADMAQHEKEMLLHYANGGYSA